MALKITQGDAITLQLTAHRGGSAMDLTGATLETRLKQRTGTLVLTNAAHTVNPDQTANRGKYTLALTALQTQALALGGGQTVVTKVTQGSSVVHFRGDGILTVLSPNP